MPMMLVSLCRLSTSTSSAAAAALASAFLSRARLFSSSPPPPLPRKKTKASGSNKHPPPPERRSSPLPGALPLGAPRVEAPAHARVPGNPGEDVALAHRKEQKRGLPDRGAPAEARGEAA